MARKKKSTRLGSRKTFEIDVALWCHIVGGWIGMGWEHLTYTALILYKDIDKDKENTAGLQQERMECMFSKRPAGEGGRGVG